MRDDFAFGFKSSAFEVFIGLFCTFNCFQAVGLHKFSICVLGELVTFKLEYRISLKDTKLGGESNLDTIRIILAASYFRRKKVFKLVH